jgi:CHAT domain-containing protein
VATSLISLGALYRDQEQYVRAEPLYQRSRVIYEKALGPEHPYVATSLNNLAALYKAQEQYARAEPLYQQSLAINEKALGSGHPNVATSLNNLAALYRDQGQYARAEPLYLRSLAIREKALGTEHPDVATSLAGLGSLHLKKGTLVPARHFYERSRQVRLALTRLNADVDEEAVRGLAMKGDRALLVYAGVLATITRDRKQDDKPGSAWRDAFVVLEQARSGLAQSALAKTSARGASSDPATSTLARDVQDLRNRREALTKRLDAEYGNTTAQRNQELVYNLQLQRQKLDNELKSAVNRLNQAFPKYAELASPEPITLASAEKLLYPDEALINYFALDDRLLLWLVRKGKEVIYRDIEIKKDELKKLVSSVRESLDQSKNTDFAKFGNLVPFDVGASHELYKRLISPLRDHLSGVKKLIVVPDEVLLPLPFAALVTSNEAESFQRLFELQRQGVKLNPRDQQMLQYSKLPWLLKDYGLTVLPSATSLRALREIPRTKPKETELLIAFGDPVLDGKGTVRGGTMLASRGSFIPVDEIRKMNRLPGSRSELQAIAKALGASSDSIFLDEQATETVVTKLNLSGRLAKAEVVAFSTHGLVSGELKGLREPALVLTPPKTSSEEDDGLLGLEDILKLKLDSADWVILSACNTGAADGSGEGLSGLARAFFFAGAKTLLVSHWSVEDRATQTLMTEIFQRYAKDKTLPRAEAVKQGMLSLMNGARSNTSYFAHPFAWAPFFIVGD